MNISKLYKIVYVILILLLLYSVIKSGLYYQYDSDELSHGQYVYLLQSGLKPYSSFIMTFTPLFYFFLMPVFSLSGFTFTSFFSARIVMVILFLLRVLISFFLVRRIFNKFTALIFVPLLLLDPFTVFSAMQIRNDNLMVTVFTLGFLLFTVALDRKNKILLFLSGFVLSLSAVILLKIIPGLIILVLLYAIFCIIKKQYPDLLIFSFGLIFPAALLLLYAYMLGFLQQMLQQVIMDRTEFNSSLLNPSTVRFYYKPGNFYLFGLPGRPLNWYFTLILPFTSVFGAIMAIISLSKKFRSDITSLLKLIFVTLLFVQFIWILTVSGIFLQYFLTASYLMAAFTAVFLSRLNRYLILTLILIFTFSSVKANLSRAKYTSLQTIANFENNFWKVVPENEKTFPNILFRPLSYPLVYGAYIGDAPKKVLKRYPPIYDYLEKDRVKYVLLNDYDMQFIDPKTQNYIRNNYVWDPKTSIWYRK